MVHDLLHRRFIHQAQSRRTALTMWPCLGHATVVILTGLWRRVWPPIMHLLNLRMQMMGVFPGALHCSAVQAARRCGS